MRYLLPLLSLLSLAALACSDPSPSPSAQTQTTDAQVETVQRRFAAGAWLGKTAGGDACVVYVKQAAGGGLREFDLRVSVDKENLLNGVPLPVDDRPTASMFYLSTSGATSTVHFAVEDASIDVESDDQSVEGGRASHLHAVPNAGGFASVEVSETRNGSTSTHACDNVTKK